MSWLRIDDKFGQHPKVLGLTDRAFRIHVLVLCYCAEYRTEGHVPRSAWRTLGITEKVAEAFTSSGLWDMAEGDYIVHDFKKYNPTDSTAAERKSRERSRKRHGDVTETSRAESRSSHAGTRARTRPVPSPTPEEPDALGTTAVLLEAGSSASAAAETSTFDPSDYDRSDPVLRLLAALPDRDNRTEQVLRSFRLSEASYAAALEAVQQRGGGSGYAVQVLKRIQAEGQLATPRPDGAEEPPTRTNVVPADPEEAIRTMIRNGVIADSIDLEAELTAAGINGDTATELRTLVPAGMDGPSDRAPFSALADTQPEDPEA